MLSCRGGEEKRAWYTLLAHALSSFGNLLCVPLFSAHAQEPENEAKIIPVSQKSAHGWSTLQVFQRRGWVLFQVTMKEHPMLCFIQ